ncbi:MAG: alpha/beta hydrolase-fold protein [Flavobacteriaceae bacterium]|nr:alpha/beta hydrolase-fold protein [Flavobacteriaceae bacterium]
MKPFFFILAGVFSLLQAQVTLQITSIPSNTPEGATIYAAGSFNSWNPGDPNFTLTENNGTWTITIPEGTGTAEFKFTRGNWASVEGNENGGYIDNRTFTFTGQAQTIELQILSWEDLGGTSQSTAAWNVSIMDEAFYMPQLDRSRKIWLYLPPDYETSAKNYPVIYMHDGQNLFDNQTAFAGEWEVDETLNSLFEQGDYGAIVIGIENGQNQRINEYSPWNNPEYGGGEGQAFVQFIVETLKPYVDTHYRTLAQANFTAMIGSSMGGLISTYAGIYASDTFDKIGAFSPSYWFALEDLTQYISSSTADLSDMRIYFVGSANESATLETNINAIQNNLESLGLSNENSLIKIDNYGGHNEAYWRGEFAAAYQWLFANESMGIESINIQPQVQFHMNNNHIYINGLQKEENIGIYDINGKLLQQLQVKNGQNSLKSQLSKGLYFLKGETLKTKILVK